MATANANANASAERLRLARDVASAEKELDKALMLLGRAQRAVVDAGSRIMDLHAALLEIRRVVELPGLEQPVEPCLRVRGAPPT